MHRMGGVGGSQGHPEEDKVRHDVNEDDRSWMRAIRTPEAAVDAAGAHYSHRRVVSSVSGGLRDFVFVDGIAISEDEYAQVYAKPEPKAKKVLHECNGYHQGSLYNGVTQHDPSVDQYISDAQGYEDSQVPTHDEPGFKTLSPGSIYRGPGDQRPLSTKAFEFVKKGAEGIASVSRTAAVEIAKVSWTTSKQVIDKSMELQNLAVPILAPIFQAVIDEGRDQLMGPSDKESEREHIEREAPNPAELERMATPYVQPTGGGKGGGRRRGRGKGHVPMSQGPMQQPAMEGAHRPVMLPMASGRAGGIPPQAGILPMGISAPRDQ